MEIFNANSFRTFVNENVEDQDIIDEVATLTNKHLEDIIIPHIDKESLSKIINQAFSSTVDNMIKTNQYRS